MPTEKQIKKIEAEIEIEKANTVYIDENFILVKMATDYYIRNLTDYDICLHIQEPYERIFVRAYSQTYFASDGIGEEIAHKIISHKFTIAMDKSGIPIQKLTFAFSDELKEELGKQMSEYKESARENVDSDDTLTLYESSDGSCWVCRKCQMPFEAQENGAHYCPNCRRKIYDFIKE